MFKTNDTNAVSANECVTAIACSVQKVVDTFGNRVNTNARVFITSRTEGVAHILVANKPPRKASGVPTSK